MKLIKDRIYNVLWRLFCSIWFIIASMICSICIYIKKTYAVTSEEIINTLLLPTEGTGITVILDAIRFCVPIIFCVGVVASITVCLIDIKFYKKRDKTFKIWRKVMPLIAISSVVLSLVYVNVSYGLINFFTLKNSSSTIYEEYYVDPLIANITTNGTKRNLIYIYIESMENTYADTSIGGAQKFNYIPNLTKLAKDNISFSNTEKLGGFMPSTGTGWTMGGLLASTSGVPFSFPMQGNKMELEELFGSGLHTMGDFLAKEGYNNYFLCGSDAAFAGRDKYFSQHGNYKIFDYYAAIDDGYISKDYYKWWGYEDLKLYEIAKDKLAEISKDSKPFNFTLLTVDMHATSGYICSECENIYPDQLANVVTCADRQVSSFIDWIKAQDFYKNTTIVITGDHIRMDKDLVSDIDDDYDRTVYNCFINAVSQPDKEVQENRIFTTEDIFPTTLASMGYNINGERLGLGTNLFSGKQTLAEQMGIEELNTVLLASSDYYIDHFSPELNVETKRDQYKDDECIATICFCGTGYNLDMYDYAGISYAEDEYSWTDGYNSRIVIPLNTKKKKLFVSLKVTHTYTENPKYIIKCNGQVVLSGTADYYGYLEFETENIDNEITIELEMPDAVSSQVYGSEDNRILSLALYDLKVYELN